MRVCSRRLSLTETGTIYCADYRCSHSIAVNADQWPDNLRLSEIEHCFICAVCGKRGADVRPDL